MLRCYGRTVSYV